MEMRDPVPRPARELDRIAAADEPRARCRSKCATSGSCSSERGDLLGPSRCTSRCEDGSRRRRPARLQRSTACDTRSTARFSRSPARAVRALLVGAARAPRAARVPVVGEHDRPAPAGRRRAQPRSGRAQSTRSARTPPRRRDGAARNAPTSSRPYGRGRERLARLRSSPEGRARCRCSRARAPSRSISVGRDQIVAVDRPLPHAPGARARSRAPGRSTEPPTVAPLSGAGRLVVVRAVLDAGGLRHLGDRHVPPALVGRHALVAVDLDDDHRRTRLVARDAQRLAQLVDSWRRWHGRRATRRSRRDRAAGTAAGRRRRRVPSEPSSTVAVLRPEAVRARATATARRSSAKPWLSTSTIVELRVLLHGGDDLRRHHQVRAVADQHVHLALRRRQLDADAAGDLVAHARVAVLDVVALRVARAPELVQVARHRARGAHDDVGRARTRR